MLLIAAGSITPFWPGPPFGPPWRNSLLALGDKTGLMDGIFQRGFCGFGADPGQHHIPGHYTVAAALRVTEPSGEAVWLLAANFKNRSADWPTSTVVMGLNGTTERRSV
jgi:hypothetical protein